MQYRMYLSEQYALRVENKLLHVSLDAFITDSRGESGQCSLFGLGSTIVSTLATIISPSVVKSINSVTVFTTVIFRLEELIARLSWQRY